MPSSSDEPDNYSIDKMMERLKKRSSDSEITDHKWVTRADGSMKIRVRKRKRRTSQPNKDKANHTKNKRIIQISIACLVIVSFAATIATALIYANSQAFKMKLMDAIQAQTSATADLALLRISPNTAHAQTLKLDWPNGNLLKSLSIRGLTAKLHPQFFFSKRYNGESITALEATALLNLPNGQSIPARQETTTDSIFLFKRYTISKLHMLFGQKESPTFHIRGSEASFQPADHKQSQNAQLLLHRGELHLPERPPSPIDRAYIIFRGDDLDILHLRLAYPKHPESIFELRGTISPKESQRQSTLAVCLESYPIEGIIDHQLAALFTTPDRLASSSYRIETVPTAGMNQLSFYPANEPKAKLSIAFKNSAQSSLALARFHFLSQLAKLTGDSWFAKPMFDNQSTGVIHIENGTTTIDQIHFEDKLHMFVRGSLTADASQKLTGSLTVGIPNHLVRDCQNPLLTKVLNMDEGGFRRVKINISGTVSSPIDDFQKQLDMVTHAAVPANSSSPSQFDQLAAPLLQK